MLNGVFKKLEGGQHKGQNGTILVIGGSRLYTGAPLFSAKAALRAGADLVHILSSSRALASLKTLPEAIVGPVRYDERVLSKITACVFGPGLGRVSPRRLATIEKCLRFLDARGVPVVIDADGIHYYKEGALAFLTKCVLTPNCKESTGLSVAPGHTCVYKGKTDRVASGASEREVDDQGAAKRCGGQGDILSGVLATALSVARGDDYLQACADACRLVRKAARLAFSRSGYGLITSDIIDELPNALHAERRISD
ncbi:ATP-dependent NAD(P)H-hydrate dehydratase [Pancytospora philotis]|nr:ATP-dependent NAD(P)H-hydrate dehydratase [Pancytospora philotis]